MPVHDFPIQDLVLNDDGSGPWNPMTPAIPTAGLRQFRLKFYLEALPTGLTCWGQPQLEFSDNGVTWRNRQSILPSSTWFDVVAGWDQSGNEANRETYKDLLVDYSNVGAFVRFGAQFRTTTSSNKRPSMRGLVRLEAYPVSAQTIAAPRQSVYTDGTTSYGELQPMTDWIPTASVQQVRAAYEVTSKAAATGESLVVTPAFQLADEPSDPTTWVDSASYDFGTAQTDEGVVYATTFTDVSSYTATAAWVRFGFKAKNDTGDTALNAILVGATFHYRTA